MDAEFSDRYACLSYVWGGAKTLKTEKESLNSLKEENSLEARRDEIPRTIRDTIDLVHQLGIPYLWVDSLCIVQDDAESKHNQIEAMAGVYANAYVTIIAGNGWDADHGLRGIQGVTLPRQLSPFSKSDFRENLQQYSSIWYSRGWTFQELLFSPRKIMFQYQLATWQCNQSAWHETSLSKISLPLIDAYFKPKISPWQGEIEVSAFPDIQQYIKLVREYSRRKLTYSDDALPAISSLLSVMSSSFDGGFISGLPEMFFDEALLWQPMESMQRRSSSPGANNPPSWSWAGWEGDLMGPPWEEHYNHLAFKQPRFRGWRARRDVELPVIPIVQWYWGNHLDENVPVSPSGGRYVEHFTRHATNIPTGWRRYATYYKYNNDPRFLATYPLPIPEGQSSRVISARYLFCRTTRAYLRSALEKKILIKLDLGNYYSTMLEDKDCNIVGSLNLNLSPAHSLSERSGIQFELVAISAGTTLSKNALDVLPTGGREASYALGWGHNTSNFKVGEDMLTGLVERFYYVLWIQWENGIAYRRGLGRVLKDAWEREVVDEIDLVLG